MAWVSRWWPARSENWLSAVRKLRAKIAKLIDESVIQVNAGAEVSKDAAQKFEGVMSSVGRAGASVQQIAKEAEQQREVAHAVSTLIEALVVRGGAS